MTEYRKVCLSVNGAKFVKLEKGKIEFKNLFKKIQVPFEIYSDFEFILKSVESYESPFIKKKYQDHVRCSLTANLFVSMIDLVTQLLFTEVKILLINLLKQFLKSMNTVKK